MVETVVLGWPCGDDVSDDPALLDPFRPLHPPVPTDPSDPSWPDEECLRTADDVPSDVVLRVLGPEGLPGQWVDAGLSAMSREKNRVAWQHCRWVLAASRAVAHTSERVYDRPRAGKIVAASLGWSEGYADQRIEFARQVLERLPALGEAMREGALEERKALIFTGTLADLDDAQAAVVVERLLSSAPGLAYERLRLRVEQTAAAVDQAWAAARRAAAVARRRVAFRVAPSGGAELCGLDLPEEAAQDAHDRIVALAAVAARELKAAGIGVPVGPVESEVMLVLTGPAGVGMVDRDVIDHVITRFGGTPHHDDGDPDSPDGPDGEGPDGHDSSGPDDDGPDGPDGEGPDSGDDDDPDRGGPSPDGDSPAGDGPVGPDDPDRDSPDGESESAEVGAAARDDAAPGAEDASTEDDGTDARSDPGAGGECDDRPEQPDTRDAPQGSNEPDRRRWAVPFVARVALRVGLLTVLGLDHRPGEIPGRGVITSAVATAMAWARTHSTWRLLLYDEHGALAHVLTLRPPRHGPPPVDGRRRHHIVEITARTTDLDALHATLDPAHPDPPTLWTDTNTDTEVACGSETGPGTDTGTGPRTTGLGIGVVGGVVSDEVVRLVRQAAKALAAARARPADEHPARTTADADRRFPGAALRAWVQARDRYCRAPGCSADAVRCDLDHTHDWLRGGRTVAGGLGPFCRRDHLFKHDPDAGWTVVQSSPGQFTWTAPTGRVHQIGPEPYDPLPDPVAPAHGGASLPSGLLDGPPHRYPAGRPRPNQYGYITDAARATATRLRHRTAGTTATSDDDEDRDTGDGVQPAAGTPDADERPPF